MINVRSSSLYASLRSVLVLVPPPSPTPACGARLACEAVVNEGEGVTKCLVDLALWSETSDAKIQSADSNSDRHNDRPSFTTASQARQRSTHFVASVSGSGV